MVIVSIIYPSSKIKADGFPNDATGVSPNGKYYSAGRENRLGMVTSDELHTATELFGFCMANSKKYPGYDSKKDEYFGVYEQILNLNKESFNKLVRDNHTYGNIPTSPEELWDKVSKLIYILLYNRKYGVIQMDKRWIKTPIHICIINIQNKVKKQCTYCVTL